MYRRAGDGYEVVEGSSVLPGVTGTDIQDWLEASQRMARAAWMRQVQAWARARWGRDST
jgi:hypothetical protein